MKKISWVTLLLLVLFGTFHADAADAPDFSMQGADGKPYALADYQGKDLVLYFWATWCPACVRDAENFKKVYETYRERGIEFLSVSLDRDLSKLNKFLAERDIRYPVLFGGKAWDLPMAADYGIDSTPSYVIISKEGEIIRKGAFSGPLEQDLKKMTEGGRDSLQRAPDFSGTDIRGVRHALKDYQGKSLLLYFWATWCPACRRETASIQNLFPRLQQKKIELVTVSLDQDRDSLENYVRESEITFPVLFEGKAWDNRIAQDYAVQSTPAFVLISPDGKIIQSGHWSRELEKILKGSIPPSQSAENPV